MMRTQKTPGEGGLVFLLFDFWSRCSKICPTRDNVASIPEAATTLSTVSLMHCEMDPGLWSVIKKANRKNELPREDYGPTPVRLDQHVLCEDVRDKLVPTSTGFPGMLGKWGFYNLNYQRGNKVWIRN